MFERIECASSGRRCGGRSPEDVYKELRAELSSSGGSTVISTAPPDPRPDWKRDLDWRTAEIDLSQKAFDIEQARRI